MATLEEFCPGINNAVLHRQAVTPWDLEQDFGLTEGNIFHGGNQITKWPTNLELGGAVAR